MDPSGATVREAEQSVGALEREPTTLCFLSAHEGSALLLHAGLNELFQTHKKCLSRSREAEEEPGADLVRGRAVLSAQNKKYSLHPVDKTPNYTEGGGRGAFLKEKEVPEPFCSLKVQLR